MKPSCYASKCEGNKITFTVDDVKYTCKHGDEHISVKIRGKHHKVACPYHERFCLLKDNECGEQCNQRGNCVTGKCYCYAGFQGEFCQEKQL